MNDPASLQHLHPIVMPTEVGIFPLAPGWYLVGAALAMVLFWLGRKALGRWRAERYRREGLNRLAALRRRVQQGERQALRELPVLLKGVALVAYPRERVAGLYGDGWRDFLNGTVSGGPLGNSQLRLLQEMSWCPPARLDALRPEEVDAVFGSIRRWLQKHRREETAGGDA